MNVEYASHVGAVPTAANAFNRSVGHSVVRMDSGGLAGSRWGLRGTEDLGGGLRSVFVLESGIGRLFWGIPWTFQLGQRPIA